MYRRCAAYIFALVLAAGPAQPNALCAQTVQAAGNQSSKNQTISLEGTVVNAQTGEPVRKAQVSIYWLPIIQSDSREPITVSTDASGRFTVTGLDPGQYLLSAEANLFVPQSYGAGHPGGRGKTLILGAGQKVDELTVRLQPCGVITGTIRDEGGDPVEGANVLALPLGRNIGLQGGRQTNDVGEYRLYNLTPGQYLVQASYMRARQKGANPQQTYVPTFYPRTANPEEAIPVSAQPGSEVQGIDIDLKPVRAVRVLGRIINQATGQPANNGYVMLLPHYLNARTGGDTIYLMSARRTPTGVRDLQGDFEIEGVSAGSYWVYGTIQQNDRQYQGRVPVEVGDTDALGVELPVNAGMKLTGRLRTEPTQVLDFSKVRVSLDSLDGYNFIWGQGAQANSDGTFVLDSVPGGNHRLNMSGLPERYYVNSMRFGGRDVLGGALSVASSGAAALDIVLSSSGGSVSGAVLKDHQPAQATVFLVPDSPRRDRQDLYSWKLTKPDGTFTMLGVPPGDFKLFAFEDPDFNDLRSDPSVFQPYETKGLSVHNEDGKSQSVQLELIPADGQP